MKNPVNYYSMQDFKIAVELLMRHKDLKSVTVFVNPLNPKKGRIRGTRKGKDQIVLTYGRLNYAEKEHVRKTLKARLLLPKQLLRFKPKK